MRTLLRPFSIFVSSLTLIALSAVVQTAKGDTVTFDSPPSPGAVQLSTATFQGFTFATAENFNHVASGHFSAAVANNGTSYLVVSSGSSFALNMSLGGQQFSLSSFDADTFVHIQGTTSITVVGLFSDGSTISQSFVTDNIGDGPGPLADFQTFQLNGFTNVVSVAFTSSNNPFALDNVGATTSGAPVPEPATMFLLGTGLTGLGGLIRRRRKNSRL